MSSTRDSGAGAVPPPAASFRHAPEDWTPAAALETAHAENLALTDDHWEMLRALQDYFARNADEPIRRRALHDALEEKFHHKGGMRYLYTLFPGGPVAQGCRLAGLKPPAGAVDTSYGSVA
jgi:tRNA 2-thiouridine synthesizing protein E